jgi:undecaprenyl-diphosphatase
MDWLQATLLGMIQGLTEFLPVSSTGHLYLGRHLFGLDEAGLFLDTMLHLGTLLAVMGIYRRELAKMLARPFSRLSLLVWCGTVPTVLIGLLFHDYFERIFRTGATVGWEFLATALILWGADSVKNQGHKGWEEIRFTDALWIGLFQGAAIMPALSRSGLTIAAALFRRIERKTAASFSFLLSIPAIFGGVVFEGAKLVKGTAETIPLSSLLIGTSSSAFFGYLAVKWMISILQRKSLKGFALYVAAMGLFILCAQRLGVF